MLPGYKVEVKNINSFSFVSKAIEYEIKRQAEILDKGETPAQETRGFSEGKGATVSQRSKEEAQDYRYFPEPDLPDIKISQDQINQIKSGLPEMPWQMAKRYESELGIKKADAKILTDTKEMADFFESAVEHGKKHEVSAQDIANYIINRKIDINSLLPTQVIEDVKGKKVGVISDDSQLEGIAREVISENVDMVESIKKGRTGAIQALIGQVMKKTQGKADAGKTKLILEKLLK